LITWGNVGLPIYRVMGDFTVLWATQVFRITEREVQAQVAMYPDEGGEVIRPAWTREHADDLRPRHARCSGGLRI
jgi:hypothetical protein